MGKDKAISKIKMPKKATATAQKTAAKVKKPVTKAVHRVYKKPRFFRPKTKSLTRTPKLMRSIRKTVGQYGNSDPHKLILYPVTSDKNAQIKKVFENLLSVKVRSVNTMIRPDGNKKAYIRLAANHDSLKVASKVGIL